MMGRGYCRLSSRFQAEGRNEQRELEAEEITRDKMERLLQLQVPRRLRALSVHPRTEETLRARLLGLLTVISP